MRPSRVHLALRGVVAVAVVVSAVVIASATPPDSPLVGTWRGTSACVEKGTSCRDEIAVYRISAAPGQADVFLVDGGKVVDGEDVSMGVLEGRFDAKTRTLTVASPQGSIVLELGDNTLTGTFLRPNKQVLRRINLKKVASAASVLSQ